MCGIAGLFSPLGRPAAKETLEAMEQALAHRGPDGRGFFSSGPVGLAHRRLAVLDLSERSAQPTIHAPTGSALSFNGEIYNYIELRDELVRAGETFFSRGDAEVLLKGLVKEGERFLARVDGDFAFAFWDAKSNELHLARDRFGVKPLFFSRLPNGDFAFASEIRALFAAGTSRAIRKSAVAEYLQYRYLHGERTMFESIEAVAPGEWLTLNPSGLERHPYWQLNPTRHSSYAEGLESFGAALERSVSRRLRSDVDLGILLSGGIDSSVLGSLMRKGGDRKVHAVTYDLPGHLSEAKESAEIASRLGFEHHLVSPTRILDRVPRIVNSLEQPLGDSIVFAMDDLFSEARKHMKVVVSGEGADEIFGGYAHHQVLRRWEWIRDSVGHRPLRMSAKLLDWVPMAMLQRLLPYPAKLNESARDRARALLRTSSMTEAHRLSSSLMTSHEISELLDGPTVESSLRDVEGEDFAGILKTDLKNWLPNYGLSRTDRLSMAYGLECRVPYLSHDVVEAGLGLAIHFAGSPLEPEKKPLRDWVKTASPDLSPPRKKPFLFPLRESHEKNFLNACEVYLNPETIKRSGLLSSTKVQALRSRPLDFLQEKKLMSLILLQAWHDQWAVSLS